jgi:pyruvate dehydrogenase E1 component alpha subunit
LVAEKVINDEQYEAIDAKLKAEANAAAQFAEQSSPPTGESVFEDVYYEVDHQTEAGKTGRFFFND